jgi:hypothetical protein
MTLNIIAMLIISTMIIWLMIWVHVLEDKVRRLEFTVQDLDDKRRQADAKQQEEDLQKWLDSRRMAVSDAR